MNFCRNCGTSLEAAAPPADLATLRGRPKSAVTAPTRSCPSCGGQTPAGFAFCQHCGGRLPADHGSDPGSGAAPGPDGRPAGVVSGETGVDATAPTLAADGAAGAAQLLGRSLDAGAPRSSGAAGAAGAPGAGAWGVLVSVNSDGTDGQRFALSGEHTDVGRTEGEIRFGGDQFLAHRHARFSRVMGAGRGGAPRVQVASLDRLNGVYRRLAEPTPLSDGAVVLLGREVLRFEIVTPAEQEAAPMVQHGVIFFGSPPRQPWGRLVQVLPSGAACDVRHLVADTVIVGREEGDIVFRDDAFLSRRHAAFTRGDDGYAVEDLGSSNGTFLRIEGPVGLRPGDHLRMGDQLFRVELD